MCILLPGSSMERTLVRLPRSRGSFIAVLLQHFNKRLRLPTALHDGRWLTRSLLLPSAATAGTAPPPFLSMVHLTTLPVFILPLRFVTFATALCCRTSRSHFHIPPQYNRVLTAWL